MMKYRAFAMLVVGSLACNDPGGNTGGVLSVEVKSPPFPAVVVLDTLRDSVGVAARLRATAFGVGGTTDTIRDARIRFVALDSSLRIDTLGYLVAINKDPTKHGKQAARYV